MGQEEDPEGVVVRRLWDREEEEAVIEDQAEVEEHPFRDEEGAQRQKPGRR